jgi:hypothetical protein
MALCGQQYDWFDKHMEDLPRMPPAADEPLGYADVKVYEGVNPEKPGKGD